MTSAFITLFVESFSAIFENITYAKWDEMFVWGKNVPSKQNPGYMKVGTLLIYLHINRFSFLIESFYEVRSHLTEALALPGCFFSIEIPPKNVLDTRKIYFDLSKKYLVPSYPDNF